MYPNNNNNKEKNSVNETYKYIGPSHADPHQQVQPGFYLVDFSKMNNVQDLIMVLAAMGITFHSSHPHFNMVKPFLNLDNVIPDTSPTPQPVPIKLPSLKKL